MKRNYIIPTINVSKVTLSSLMITTGSNTVQTGKINDPNQIAAKEGLEDFGFDDEDDE